MTVTINKQDYNLLIEIYKHLHASSSRPELASALLKTIDKLSKKLD